MRISPIIADILQIINRSHGDLQDLGVDDHTTYVDVAGTRACKNIASGVDAEKSETPAVGDVYLATDTNKLYTCVTAESWTQTDWIVIPSGSARGDILFRDASGWTRLAKGTATQMLKMNGAANAPEWSSTVPNNSISKESLVNYYKTAGTVITHDSGTGVSELYSGSIIKCGVKKDYSGSPIVLKKIGFYLKKDGSPTGDVTYEVRTVSGDNLLASSVVVQAEDLTTSFVLHELTLNPCLYLDVDIRIVVCYNNTGAPNKLVIVSHGGDIYANEMYTRWISSWTELSGSEIDNKITTADIIHLTE